MAQVPTRTDAEREAGREEFLRDLRAAREELEREGRRRARGMGRTHDARHPQARDDA